VQARGTRYAADLGDSARSSKGRGSRRDVPLP